MDLDKLKTPSARRFLVGVGFVTLLLGVGFASYYLGGDRSSGTSVSNDTVSVQLSDSVGRGGYEVVEKLELPWGSGERAVANVPDGNRTTLDTIFLGGDDRVYVVDHAPGRVGARVRWFKKGSLVGSHAAPGGATLFTADGDGFMYVLAKSAGPSEQVVVVDGKGSVTATYTVPLGLNSGGLVRSKDTIYARAFSSTTDPQQKEYEAKDVLVPVATGGKQLDDATAEAGIVEAWTVLDDGVRVTSRFRGKPNQANDTDVTHLLRFGAGDAIEMGSSSILLGVSVQDRALWLLYPPSVIDARGTAGWPALYDAQGMLLKVAETGKTLAMIPVPMPRIANPADFGWRGRVSTDGERVAVATADATRVKILVFGRR